MPDSLAPVTVETADGFMVISKKLTTVLPPARYQYTTDFFDHEADAVAFYGDIERGEYAGWEPHAIVPTLRGIPLGSKKVLP